MKQEDKGLVLRTVAVSDVRLKDQLTSSPVLL